jgi:microcystin-dependent protein
MTTKVSLIADGSVNSSAILNTTIKTEDLENNAVTTSKINFETALVPLGGIIMWSGTTTPSGYQLCNGTDLPSTSPLRPGFTNTPNLQDRFIVGAGSGYVVGNTGGDNSVALGTNNVPYHNHEGTTYGQSNGHDHAFPGDDQLSFASNKFGWTAGSLGNFGYDAKSSASGGNGTMWVTGANRSDHNHTFATDFRFGNAQGGTDAHENRPPYYALAFIMRVL